MAAAEGEARAGLDRYEFEGPIERRNMGVNAKGTLYYNVVYLPADLLSRGRNDANNNIQPHTRGLRIRGACHGQSLNLALQPDRSRGAHYLILSKGLLKKIDKSVNDDICVSFELVDPNNVEVPEILQRRLNRKATARRKWDTLSAGQKRTWVTFVNTAKTQATRESRVEEILGRLISNQLDRKQRYEER